MSASSIVERHGVSVEVETADLVDQLFEHFAVADDWPFVTAFDSRLVRSCIAARLVGVSDAEGLFLTLRGAVVAAHWPAVEGVVAHYLSFVLGETRKREDRYRRVAFSWPGFAADLAKRFTTHLVAAHTWYGTAFAREADGTLTTSVSLSMARLLDVPGLTGVPLIREVLAAPDLTAISASANLATLRVERTHDEVRSHERRAMERVVATELCESVCLSFGAPRWLRRTVMDYLCEGDLALRSGAAFAAVVMYGGAVESVLAFRYQQLPASSTHVPANQLKAMFSAASLYDQADQDAAVAPALGRALRRARAARNTIHANLYVEGAGGLAIADAVRLREVLRELAGLS